MAKFFSAKREIQKLISGAQYGQKESAEQLSMLQSVSKEKTDKLSKIFEEAKSKRDVIEPDFIQTYDGLIKKVKKRLENIW